MITRLDWTLLAWVSFEANFRAPTFLVCLTNSFFARCFGFALALAFIVDF